jgi:hypothetical protein
MRVIICKAILFIKKMVIQMMSMNPCNTMIYIWNMMLVQRIILLMIQLFQSSNQMTIILQWQKQQNIRISLKKLLGEMNNQ